MRSAKRPLLIGCGVLVAVFLLCGFGGFFALRAPFARAAAQLPDELEGARREGLPLEPGDLRRDPPLTPADNAAPIYRKAIAMLEEERFQVLLKDANASEQGRPVTIPARRAALAELRPVLDLIRTAAGKPGCDFDRDWSLGFDVLFPELAGLKQLVKLLANSAEEAALAGDWPRAFGDVRASYALAQHAGEDPILIGMLVQVSIEAIASRSFERCLGMAQHDPRALVHADRALQMAGDLPNLRRALEGELVLGRTAFAMDTDWGVFMEEDGMPEVFDRMTRMPVVAAAFESRLVAAYRKLFAALPEDPTDWETAAAALTAFERENEEDRSFTNTLNRIRFPVFGQAADAVGYSIARRRMLQTAVRLVRHRQHTGAFPAILPPYGEFGIDLFDGRPLRYQPAPDGFVLYSVGRNRVDDGGDLRDDLVVTIGPGRP
jgi:hypothetical protein